jgi:hypothetical protein
VAQWLASEFQHKVVADFVLLHTPCTDVVVVCYEHRSGCSASHSDQVPRGPSVAAWRPRPPGGPGRVVPFTERRLKGAGGAQAAGSVRIADSVVMQIIIGCSPGHPRAQGRTRAHAHDYSRCGEGPYETSQELGALGVEAL